MKKIVCSLFIACLLVMMGNAIYGMTYYEELDFVTGIVTASALNVRTGPGTQFPAVGLVYQNEYVRVFAKVGDWYVIQTEKDLIGAASSKYIRKVPTTNNTAANQTTGGTPQTTTGQSQNITNTQSTNIMATAEEQELLKLINEQRAAYGLVALKWDAELQKVAKLKAQDLVKNNYFSHQSPTYGSPFEMMQSFGITYKAAGENIAGNATLKGAVNAWMNSQGHRDNILSNAYNYTGIGVVDSPIYGKVMVQMFIGK